MENAMNEAVHLQEKNYLSLQMISFLGRGKGIEAVVFPVHAEKCLGNII